MKEQLADAAIQHVRWEGMLFAVKSGGELIRFHVHFKVLAKLVRYMLAQGYRSLPQEHCVQYARLPFYH